MGDLTISAKNVYISLPHVMAARTAGIDRNGEITPVKFNLCILGVVVTSLLYFELGYFAEMGDRLPLFRLGVCN